MSCQLTTGRCSLMIHLGLEADTNRFCFFFRDEDQIRCYWYATFIFGFTTSSLVLRNILKFHAAQYPVDACHTIMDSWFYLDNLVMTESDPVKLARECRLEGGFVIQSCNINCDNLRNEISRDGTLSTPDDEWGRVLGYICNPFSEKLHSAPIRCIDQEVDSF